MNNDNDLIIKHLNLQDIKDSNKDDIALFIFELIEISLRSDDKIKELTKKIDYLTLEVLYLKNQLLLGLETRMGCLENEAKQLSRNYNMLNYYLNRWEFEWQDEDEHKQGMAHEYTKQLNKKIQALENRIAELEQNSFRPKKCYTIDIKTTE